MYPFTMSRMLLLGAALASLCRFDQLHAASLKWAVTAAVSNAAASKDTQDTYREVVEQVATAAGIRLNAVPIYGVRVAKALDAGTFPLLLVHANDAAHALRYRKYKLVALSRDTQDNRISFVARKDSTVRMLTDLVNKCVVATEGFSADVARNMLAREALYDRLASFRQVRDGEALPFFLEHRYCDVGVTRSASLVSELEKSGGTVIYQTQAYPVHAVIVAADTDPQLVDSLRGALLSFRPAPDSAFVRSTGIQGFAAPDAASEDFMAMLQR